MGIGWHMGIVRGVSFTAWIAPTRATARTSPFFTSPSLIAPTVDSFSRMMPEASARLATGGFSVISTIPPRFVS